MKITEALKDAGSPVLVKMRKFLATAPVGSVFTIHELSAKVNAAVGYVQQFGRRKEFSENRVMHKHQMLYGSRKAIAAYQKAREALANKD